MNKIKSDTQSTAQPCVTMESLSGGIALVKLNRPEAANAVDAQITRRMQDIVRQTESDSEVRVVVLASSLPHVFCAGADLNLIAQGRIAELFPRDGGFAGFVNARRFKPWIAMVDGAAFAGGMELALACEFIICSQQARFALPEVTRGLVALAGAAQRLPLRIAAPVALDLMLTGEPIDGARAYQLGLASRLTRSEDLLASVLSIASRIAANAPGAIKDSLAVTRVALSEGEQAAWKFSIEIERARLQHPEFLEGVSAFLEKREARWNEFLS